MGVSASEIDLLAEKLILKAGAEPNFKKVEGYKWSTCINVNDGVVHGIPHKEIIFKEGDLVSIDLGVLYKGYNTDTSISFALNPTKEIEKFLTQMQNTYSTKIEDVNLCTYLPEQNFSTHCNT